MKYCFDSETTLPFLAFRALREIAQKHVGELNILDLSQGEPGYGFAPSQISREFYGFLLLLDTTFNDNATHTLFATQKPSDLEQIESAVKECAKKHYSPEMAERMTQAFDQFIARLEEVCDSQEMGLDRFGIYYELFKYSNLAGGRYPQPNGHPLFQALMAEEHSELLGTKVYAHELIGIMGASHGVGATFQALGTEALGFLVEGDTVAMTSPVYAPYNTLFAERGINVVSLSVNPETGAVDSEEVDRLCSHPDRIKALVIIDPNNPSGFPSDRQLLDSIIKIAEAHNSIIVSDEVYSGFFKGFTSLGSIPAARKRLIRIDAISKIERATGIRAGDVYVSDEANEFITEEILGDIFPKKYKNIRNLLSLCKSPGGINIGLFQHITGIPGPSVGLTLAHIILAKEEREQCTQDIIEKVKIFYETLGLEYPGNNYYGIVDLDKISSEENKAKPIEEKLEKVAEQGVVVMPANLFFSESDRKKQCRKNVIRVSLPNLSKENTKKAAEIIRSVVEN